MKNLNAAILPLLAAGLVVLSAQPAEAQRRASHRRVVVRSSVIVIGGYWYPRYYVSPYYGPYYGWGYPGPLALYPQYGYYSDRNGLASLRLQVKPVEAQVFVDGYAAGEVDRFDGVFQRLRVRPGGHEIALYLEGYRTVRRNIYASPGSDHKIEVNMVPLGPGERSEPPPQPRGERRSWDDRDDGYEGPRSGGRGSQPPPAGEPAARFGTLSIRVQPEGAELLIDGERWDAPAGQSRFAVQLAEGRHRVEVRRAGYSTYLEEVLIRPNATLSLNVSLARGDADDAGR